MTTFNKGIRTQAGKDLANRVMAGKTSITYSRLVFSSEDLSDKSDDELSELTDVEPQELAVEPDTIDLKATDVTDPETEVRAIAKNDPLTTGLHVRTYGLYAKDDSGNEILFGVALDDNPAYLPPHESGDQDQYLTYEWDTALKDTDNIKFTNTKMVFVNFDELNRYKSAVNATVASLEADDTNLSNSTKADYANAAGSVSSLQDSAASYTDYRAGSVMNQANANMETNRVSLSNSVNGLPHWPDINWTRNNVAPSLANSAMNAANGYTYGLASSINDQLADKQNQLNNRATIADRDWTRNNVVPALVNSAKNDANNYTRDKSDSLTARVQSNENNILYNTINLSPTTSVTSSGWGHYALFTIPTIKGATYYISAKVDVPGFFTVSHDEGFGSNSNARNIPYNIGQNYTNSNNICIGNWTEKQGGILSIGYNNGNIGNDAHLSNIYITKDIPNVPFNVAQGNTDAIKNIVNSNVANATNQANAYTNAKYDNLNGKINYNWSTFNSDNSNLQNQINTNDQNRINTDNNLQSQINDNEDNIITSRNNAFNLASVTSSSVTNWNNPSIATINYVKGHRYYFAYKSVSGGAFLSPNRHDIFKELAPSNIHQYIGNGSTLTANVTCTDTILLAGYQPSYIMDNIVIIDEDSASLQSQLINNKNNGLSAQNNLQNQINTNDQNRINTDNNLQGQVTWLQNNTPKWADENYTRDTIVSSAMNQANAYTNSKVDPVSRQLQISAYLDNPKSITGTIDLNDYLDYNHRGFYNIFGQNMRNAPLGDAGGGANWGGLLVLSVGSLTQQFLYTTDNHNIWHRMLHGQNQLDPWTCDSPIIASNEQDARNQSNNNPDTLFIYSD